MQITRNNVNGLFKDALWFMKTAGVIEASRNGAVKAIPEPMILTSCNPTQRVLFCPARKENPIFHFAECLWMMAGRSDSEWLERFNPRMKEFAEGSGRLHGAYGYRWRKSFGFDQIRAACIALKKDPYSRRIVIGMWNPTSDLGVDAKDLPCNTHIYFRKVGKALNMTICNRSNDLVWGALGSNIVHFSFLFELIAHEVGLPVGYMHQFTNNLHIYERHWHFLDIPPRCEEYSELEVRPYPIIQGSLDGWLKECEALVGGDRVAFREPFFNDVAMPILESRIDYCKATDWQLACKRYLER